MLNESTTNVGELYKKFSNGEKHGNLNDSELLMLFDKVETTCELVAALGAGLAVEEYFNRLKFSLEGIMRVRRIG